MSVTLLILLTVAFTSTINGSLFDMVVPKGQDFSFTCPFQVEDSDILTISRINVTSFRITGSTRSPNPRVVYNTSTGGLLVELQDTGRYTALKPDNNHYAIYIAKVQPEDSGTWRCQVKKRSGDLESGSYENLIVLGADVNLAFQRRISRSRVDVYADELEIDLTEPQLKTVAFVVNVSDLMAVQPNASITSCYEDGSSYNITSSLFHSSEEHYELTNGLVFSQTVERFGGRKSEFTGDFTKTKGKVTLEGIYQYADRIFTRSLIVKILAPPIINPDLIELVFDIAKDTVVVSTHVVAYPRIYSISLRLENSVLNFTDLYNENSSHKDNVTVSIFKAEGKFYNWYNLTIKYKAGLGPGFYGGNSITVYNTHGSDTYRFYLNKASSGSSITTFSAAILLFAVLLRLLWF